MSLADDLVAAAAEARHPGVTIREWCERTGTMRKQITLRTGLSQKHLSQVIIGNAGLTAHSAVLIEQATGLSADLLMTQQVLREVARERARTATQQPRPSPIRPAPVSRVTSTAGEFPGRTGGAG